MFKAFPISLSRKHPSRIVNLMEFIVETVSVYYKYQKQFVILLFP